MKLHVQYLQTVDGGSLPPEPVAIGMPLYEQLPHEAGKGSLAEEQVCRLLVHPYLSGAGKKTKITKCIFYPRRQTLVSNVPRLLPQPRPHRKLTYSPTGTGYMLEEGKMEMVLFRAF